MKLNTTHIKAMLATRSMTQVALAEKAGISRQSISTILGRGTCSLPNAGKLARALEVDVTEIIKEN